MFRNFLPIPLFYLTQERPERFVLTLHARSMNFLLLLLRQDLVDAIDSSNSLSLLHSLKCLFAFCPSQHIWLYGWFTCIFVHSSQKTGCARRFTDLLLYPFADSLRRASCRRTFCR